MRPVPTDIKNFATLLLPGRGLAEASRPLLNVAAVAAWLNVSTATVYRLCSADKLAHCRMGNVIRISPATVEAYLAASGGP